MTAHMRSLHLRPLGIVGGAAAAAALESGAGRRLAGGRLVYTACGVFLISKGEDGKRQLETSRVLPLVETIAWADREGNDTATAVHDWLKRVSVSPPPFAGLALDCPVGSLPLIMGIVNVTPDSFSDGGDHADPESAIAHGMEMWQAGADILDVGGESTRPGADPVAVKEEMERITPVVRGLAEHGARVSIDTRHATVMAAALETGAQIINDVSALTGDPESLSMAAKSGAPVILMHMQGDPKTMQDDPRYGFAPTEIYEYLSARIEACVAA
ncbi:MAG: dihydropteroate synthase, partial [Alphaproteobacteria bacterium]|nr:dihydropteroate synthase [Alphaproteobacteria bacterium]